MKMVVISTAPFVRKPDGYYAYAPYIREMELWAKYASLSFVCPVVKDNGKMLLTKIQFPVEKVYRAREFDLMSIKGILRGFLFFPINMFFLFRAMSAVRHIHLRCPGNLSLLGCIVQMFYPRKRKTAKYAGNWDPKSAQPMSYRWQRKILSSTFLTKNISVLVYGRWPESTKNIVPFFTASYREADKKSTPPREIGSEIRFVYAGGLSENKRPLYAAELIHKLKLLGVSATLQIYGEGVQRMALEEYIASNNLESTIILMGNRSSGEVQEAYVSSHFLILPSKSEGWPKVVAESMFWGCVPVASAVSCVPDMLDAGSRGILLTMNVAEDASQLKAVIDSPEDYSTMASKAMEWSRIYTLDKFEHEIAKLV